MTPGSDGDSRIDVAWQAEVDADSDRRSGVPRAFDSMAASTTGVREPVHPITTSAVASASGSSSHGRASDVDGPPRARRSLERAAQHRDAHVRDRRRVARRPTSPSRRRRGRRVRAIEPAAVAHREPHRPRTRPTLPSPNDVMARARFPHASAASPSRSSTGPSIAGLASGKERAANLAKDLALAQDHGVEPGRDAKRWRTAAWWPYA